MKKLHRSKTDRVLLGVFGGLGKYLNIDPVILRLIFILVFVFTGFVPGLIVYFLAAFVIPEEP